VAIKKTPPSEKESISGDDVLAPGEARSRK